METFEKALMRHDDDRMFWAMESVLTHYWLGRAYEASGWTDQTVQQYQRFLEIWQDADTEIPEIAEARAALSRLQS